MLLQKQTALPPPEPDEAAAPPPPTTLHPAEMLLAPEPPAAFENSPWFTEVDEADVPGRWGDEQRWEGLFQAIKNARPGRVQKVPCKDRLAARKFSKTARNRAKRHGMRLAAVVRDEVCFLWRRP